jgi:magnesium-transporting ATPase (P-type)
MTNGVLVHVKDALNEVLPRCIQCLSADGNIVEVSEAFIANVNRQMEMEMEMKMEMEMEMKCGMLHRSLMIASKLVDEVPTSVEEAETGLTLVAVLSIRDSLRRHTSRSMASCQQAGIRVAMITGDDLLTAQAIANEYQQFSNDKIVITGAQLRKLLQSQLTDVLPTTAVVSRSTAAD